MMRRLEGSRSGPMPVLGLGTWMMGNDAGSRAAEVRALQLGMDLGMTLIDTAEMYANGGAEEVVGEAIEGRRDEVYLVSKVLPGNASREGTIRAAEQSLDRMRTDRMDLYLLHWEGSHPLEETVAGFETLVRDGKILRWGVSNFDVAGMASVEAAGGGACASNQILYNLVRRGPELRVIPWCRERGVSVMAYSPVEQGALTVTGGLQTVAGRHGVSPYCAAIAWTIREPGVVSIPKAGREDHVRENARAAEIRFTDDDLALLDREFPRPATEPPLETA